jgi:hemoglobin-like flavoprotein
MTASQKQYIRMSFPAIAEVLGPVSLLFYGRLFQLDPSLRPMFRSDIEVQGRKLMDMLTAVVKHLDDFETLEGTLRSLGQRHAAYGVREEHYETVQRAFLWALGQTLDAQFYPEVKAAWKTVLTEVGDVMKAGAAMCEGS